MITDNLASLFAQVPKGPAMTASFRVGRLVSFSADDGSNIVLLGTVDFGATLEDLAMLVTGAEIGLSPGDNVILMYLGNAVVIMGKIATVGGPNYGASNLGRSSADNDNTPGGFGIPLAGTIGLVPVSFPVPGWANSALIKANAGASLHNLGTTSSTGFAVLTVHNAAGGLLAVGTQLNIQTANGFVGAMSSELNKVVGMTPNDTITLALDLHVNIAWPTDSGAGANMQAAVEFYREGI